MRRKFILGLGLAGVLSGPAFAQFAADRVPPPSAPVSPATPSPLPPSMRPVMPGGGYVPPVGGLGNTPTLPVMPAGYAAAVPSTSPAPPPPLDLEIRRALPLNHPLALKPENGAYLLCVKSYSRPSRPEAGDNGPSALMLAEALAGDIDKLYCQRNRMRVYLFEYISEERKAEMAAIAEARQKAQVFAWQLEKYRQESQLRGMEFMEPDHKMHVKTQKYNDQIAVLIGGINGYKTDDEARKARDIVRSWPSPQNKMLMDGAAVSRPGQSGRIEVCDWHVNPYPTVNVVTNPTIARASAETGTDPFIVKLNEGRPYSLLKATKGWTLAVKSFSAPVEIVGRDSNSGSMKKAIKGGGGEALMKGGEQAEELAKGIREMKGPAPGYQPLHLEAFVLHTRNASLVTVGQFDSPNDPALLQTKQLLSSIKLNASSDNTGFKPVANSPSDKAFGNLMPIPIPKP